MIKTCVQPLNLRRGLAEVTAPESDNRQIKKEMQEEGETVHQALYIGTEKRNGTPPHCQRINTSGSADHESARQRSLPLSSPFYARIGSLQFQAMENKIYTGCFFPADIERGVYHTLLLTADSDVLDRLSLRIKYDSRLRRHRRERFFSKGGNSWTARRFIHRKWVKASHTFSKSAKEGRMHRSWMALGACTGQQIEEVWLRGPSKGDWWLTSCK